MFTLRSPRTSRVVAAGLMATLCLAAVLVLLPRVLPAREGAGDRPGPADLRQLQEQVDELRGLNQRILTHLTLGPEVEVQGEDYARVRTRFRSHLLHKGPAPQNWSPAKPPAGVTEVEYPSGSLRLRAWLSRPSDGGRKHPAVRFLHGGFAFAGDDWDMARPYGDAGFVVLAPQLRAENGQPGAFSYFYDEVDDVLAAADYLARQPFVDPARVFVAGHSVGGTLTLLAAQASDRFRAAAALSGGPYWPPFVEDRTLPFDRADPQEVQVRSPIAFAGSFRCPVRLYYGSEEASTHALMSQRTAALARRRGLDVEATETEGSHGSHVRLSVPRSIAFFQRLAGAEGITTGGKAEPLPKDVDLDLGDGVRMKLARVAPGTFRMGSPPSEAGRDADEAEREVTITAPYAIGVYPVTQAQYRRVTGARPSRFSARGDGVFRERVAGLNTDDFPVENVNWEDAVDFCRILSLHPDVRARGWVVALPTEAEWEYACRAGTRTAFHFGDALSSQQANFNGDFPYGGAGKGPSLGRTTRVGSYPPNAWGFHDMHGNVAQLCQDLYERGPHAGGAADVTNRVARGGYWFLAARGCRSASRQAAEPWRRSAGLGFRVVVRP